MENSIRTAVVPSAGLGIRMLPATKQQPKEMLPLFVRDSEKHVILKPLIQIVFERLYEVGLRKFLFIVGKGKRSIEDHFTVDNGSIELLRRSVQSHLLKDMVRFYRRVESAQIAFINQPQPLGFGDAVLRAKAFTDKRPFLVHAGDDLIVSRSTDNSIRRLMRIFEAQDADATFFVQKVANPSKYGVVEGKRVGPGVYLVNHVEEKPKRPKSRIAIVAMYAFNDRIYQSIERVRKSHGRELELTDAIEGLINDGGRVYAIELKSCETRLDVGMPESYWNALRRTVD